MAKKVEFSEDVIQMAAYAKAMSHPVRVFILKRLSKMGTCCYSGDLVEELPDDQKQVVIMRHYLGLSFKEIADQTDVSINTALGRMRYALINLRKIITERGLILTKA